MKLLKKVFEILRTKKEESTDLSGMSSTYNSNLYSSDDDLGFC